MTIDEARKHCLDIADGQDKCADISVSEHAKERIRECANDHRQLAEWLTELKELREQLQKTKSMILDYSYTVEVMCNRIKNTIGCENCTYCNEETYECKVGAYIARTRAFVKGGRASESD